MTISDPTIRSIAAAGAVTLVALAALSLAAMPRDPQPGDTGIAVIIGTVVALQMVPIGGAAGLAWRRPRIRRLMSAGLVVVVLASLVLVVTAVPLAGLVASAILSRRVPRLWAYLAALAILAGVALGVAVGALLLAG